METAAEVGATATATAAATMATATTTTMATMATMAAVHPGEQKKEMDKSFLVKGPGASWCLPCVPSVCRHMGKKFIQVIPEVAACQGATLGDTVASACTMIHEERLAYMQVTADVAAAAATVAVEAAEAAMIIIIVEGATAAATTTAASSARLLCHQAGRQRGRQRGSHLGTVP